LREADPLAALISEEAHPMRVNLFDLYHCMRGNPARRHLADRRAEPLSQERRKRRE